VTKEKKWRSKSKSFTKTEEKRESRIRNLKKRDYKRREKRRTWQGSGNKMSSRYSKERSNSSDRIKSNSSKRRRIGRKSTKKYLTRLSTLVLSYNEYVSILIYFDL
jgi:hypothetical protein